jgi:hypothetical protein
MVLVPPRKCRPPAERWRTAVEFYAQRGKTVTFRRRGPSGREEDVMLHAVAIAVHVLAAVLAVGVVGAIPITARLGQQAAGATAATEGILRALLRATQLGLGVMLLTGVLLDFSVAGGFHKMRWFQLSIVVLVVLGAALGRARAALRRGGADALPQVERWGWVVCASVAVITLLMQCKPLF